MTRHSPIARLDFASDKLGQRQSAKQSGAAFADYYAGAAYSGVFNTYAYNARRELQTAVMYRGDTPSATPAAADELPARRFEYRYDSIGNRVTAGATGQANTGDDEYTANALNQYTARENNTVKVLGTADAAATVAVAGTPSTTKKDRVWGADLVTEDHRHIFALKRADQGAGLLSLVGKRVWFGAHLRREKSGVLGAGVAWAAVELAGVQLFVPLKRMSIHTASASTAPRAMNFNSGDTAMSVMPLRSVVMMSAPKSTPHTLPRPPRSAVPPMSQAAMASSSMSSPTVVVDAPE